ncbi:hypothetical protein GGS24DRAFT_11413 [Hypoxylon argillaceum]|nr:hypothetical protein GGS24DRAFT_11413 [Hypoxylon argillaceum]KAI1146591.1 hypothetical protein F4825DRAFT_188597 [Nemania diffusa]
MAPIPVYTNSPITAVKPDGVTPKTASKASSPSSTYTPSTYTATATATTTTAAAAQPGAAPSLPTPTGPAVAQPYSTLQPTHTTSIASATPAPPQPGSVPVSGLPPPPRVGERYQPPTQAAATPTATMPIPPQMAIPAPTAPQPSQQRGTYTGTMASSSPYGAQVPSAITGIGGGGAQSLSHPPGYQQNANASEFDRYQRTAMEQRELDDGSSGSGIWDTAKKLAQQTGERLVAAEGEVWKRINKE